MNAGEYGYEDFSRNFAHDPGKAAAVWAMREVLGECVEAMQNGTIWYWLPSPGIAYPAGTSTRCRGTWTPTGKRRRGGPLSIQAARRFRERLDTLQATALIERLRVAKGKRRGYA